MKIKWSSGHEGHLNIDWLRKHCYSSHSLENARKSSKPDPVTKVQPDVHVHVHSKSDHD